jgi:hypothetical protein
MRKFSAIIGLLLASTSLATSISTKEDAAAAVETPAVATAEPTPAATTASSPSTAKINKCVQDLQFLAQTDMEPLEQFNKFVDEVCLGLDLRVPNGVKVASCFHTGYFLLRTLRPKANEINADDPSTKEDFDMYVSNFCENHALVLPKRTEFIKEVSHIEDAEEFTTACFNHLDDTPTLNTWFDPIDAIASVTQQEVCDLHFKLFESLREKQRTSTAEFVSFSYLASLDLFLNAYQQEDYENCVNMELVEKPAQWITEFVTSHPGLLIWSTTAKTDIAAETGADITQKCADSKACSETGACEACDGCSSGIARVYRTFELYLNTLFAEKFRDYSENMFNKLHEANLALETV